MNTRSFVQVAALLLFSSFRLSAAPEPEKFFPVMPWNYVPDDKAVVQKIKDCGFTVAGFVAPDTLKTIHAAGLKGIVQDPRIYNYDWTKVDPNTARSNVVAAVTPLAKNPAVYGFYLRDEPPATYFPGLKSVASVVHELAPDKWAYINLFPNYAENWQLGASSYEEYLEKFVETCHPAQLSYDHYGLMDDGSLREGYWRNLEQMRVASKKHNIPFWNIVLSVAHFNYREPTFADLRFEVYSSLASGARGLAYFTYFAPQVGNYRGAPIDQFGNPTPTWNWMQNVNLQIQKLAPTLLDLTSDDVYHFGSVPNGCHAASTNSLVANIGPDFAVGDFTHTNGTRYVMLVNKNVSKSAVGSPEFRKAPKALKIVSPYSGTLIPFEGEQVWIAPGAGALLKLE
ncbi:MAG: hypothetical protein JWM68_3480 [Verrucomicrobiales bacterium]|nr:hypothetical protein [Verrucomicrobiales bacterium]